ncbi:ATP-grasp domain-containing protein [Bacteroidota bacterium]
MIDNPNILICYNEPFSKYDNYIGKESTSSDVKLDLSESEFQKNLYIIQDSIKKKYNNVNSISFNGSIERLIKNINRIKPDIIYNFVESIDGDATFESYAVGMLEILGIEYTGSNAICLGNCLNKNRTKQILRYNNIRTPNYFIYKFKSKFNRDNFNLEFPVILKLIHEDASIGISEKSVVYNFTELIKQLDFLAETYDQDVIIEEYIDGRELNISILGGTILPISEIIFNDLPDNLPRIVTYEAKWSPESIYYNHSNPICPANLSSRLKKIINTFALRAYKSLDCRDYARVDIRLSKNNLPYIIEINPNPDISIDSGFVRSAEAFGLSYDKLLLTILNFAINRLKNDKEN